MNKRIPAIEAPPDTPSEERESPVSASEEEGKGTAVGTVVQMSLTSHGGGGSLAASGFK